MAEKLTLKKLNKNFEDFKKFVLDKFEKDFKVSSKKDLDMEVPNLSEYTEIGTEVDIGELGKIRLLDTNYNGTGKKIWQLVTVYKPNKISLELPNNNNKEGYPSAKGIEKVLEEIYNKISNGYKKQIVEVKIPCYIPKDKKNIDIKRKLFLLSTVEMCQNLPWAAKEGRPLEFYIKNTPEWNDWHWLRTPHPSCSYYWVIVNTTGTITNTYTDYPIGVAPAFCTD